MAANEFASTLVVRYREKLRQIIPVKWNIFLLQCSGAPNSQNLRACERKRSLGCHRAPLHLAWGGGVIQGGRIMALHAEADAGTRLATHSENNCPQCSASLLRPIGRSISANAASGTRGRAMPAAISSSNPGSRSGALPEFNFEIFSLSKSRPTT